MFRNVVVKSFWRTAVGSGNCVNTIKGIWFGDARLPFLQLMIAMRLLKTYLFIRHLADHELLFRDKVREPISENIANNESERVLK